MGNQVYANNREISCKSADGKSIAAFPDVCFTPPQAPPTPMGVPIPYPNTGMASDTTNGTRTVKITGKEIMLKNKSYYKTSYGDEAGCAPKKGVITSKNKGKVYFTSWSMNVKFEGENVVRHLDLTTHNHASMPGNTPTWPYMDKMAVAKETGPCKEEIKREKKACEGFKPNGDKDPCPPVTALKAAKAAHALTAKDSPARAKATLKVNAEYEALAKKNAGNECLQARRCMLVPYKPKKPQPGCCPGQTGHHLIEASAFYEPGSRKAGGTMRADLKKSKYDAAKAPCVCAEGPNNTTATHGLMHTYQGVRAKQLAPNGGTWSIETAATVSAVAMNMVFKTSCDPKCTEAQIHAYHGQKGVDIDRKKQIVASPSGRTEDQAASNAWASYDKAQAAAKGQAAAK
ncbi:MAG: PAAR-like domain-containing protein [Pseudomonas sp.]